MEDEKEKGVVAIDEQSRHKQRQQDLLGVKLRRRFALGMRVGGTSTPVPIWKVDEDCNPKTQQNDIGGGNHRLSTSTRATSEAVSARKLCASLLEIQDLVPTSRMDRGGDGGWMRHHHRHSHKADGDFDLAGFSPVNNSNHHDRDRIPCTGADQHYKSIKRGGRRLQAPSPVASHNHPALTPTDSSDDRENHGEELGYALKTSTQLLKVLNRIWMLEEQNTSSISMIKALKLELNHAQAHIQQLLQESQTDQQQMDRLLERMAEDKVRRKDKEREKIAAAIRSVRDELDNEKRLRKQSESLHQKLVKEMSEMKSSSVYSNKKEESVSERDRKVRGLLEELCDEFAKGIIGYEMEVRDLKQKSDKDFVPRCNKLMLHMSETWLDERIQMKLAQVHGDFGEVDTVIDRLGCEIVSFLKDKRTNKIHTKEEEAEEDPHFFRQQSLESVLLNGCTSAPQFIEEDDVDDDSVASDLHCFELNMGNNNVGLEKHFKRRSCRVGEKPKDSKKKIAYLIEQIERKVSRFRNGSIVSSEADSMQEQQNFLKAPVTPDIENCSRDVKESTLKVKLREANLEGKHARLRTCSKGSSFCA